VNAALETIRLAKCYRSSWALRDCSLRVPSGRVAALVGPNGAGKTTLLHLAVGLLAPTAGQVRVLGRSPWEDTQVLSRVGFVAQDVPMYDGFRVEEMLTLGRRLNRQWDDVLARSRIRAVGIPMKQKVGTLSGGQRAQVALSMALAKRPSLLLLDEPLASLDPLARQEFMQALMESVAENGTTVVLSSHLVTDLERMCDYLIVLQASQVQVLGEVEHLLATHRVLTGPRREASELPADIAVVKETRTARQSTLLVQTRRQLFGPGWLVQEVGLEELVLAYLGRPEASTLPGPGYEQDDGLKEAQA
jgi:ABC-2 type transport system ATP-binding protein